MQCCDQAVHKEWWGCGGEASKISESKHFTLGGIELSFEEQAEFTDKIENFLSMPKFYGLYNNHVFCHLNIFWLHDAKQAICMLS